MKVIILRVCLFLIEEQIMQAVCCSLVAVQQKDY